MTVPDWLAVLIGYVIGGGIVWFELYEQSMQAWFRNTPGGREVVEKIEYPYRAWYRRATFR